MFVCIGYVTLTEFAQYVLDEWSSVKSVGKYSSHWRPQYELCNLCDINYDYIGHFENIQNDAKYVLSKLTASGRLEGIAQNVRFPVLNAFQPRGPLSREKRNSFYASVPMDIMTKLIQMYELDYKLFGYDYSWIYHNNSDDAIQ